MPRDRVAILADGHVTGDDVARVDLLVARLQELGRRCAAVYILGDLFEVWLGVDRTDPGRARVGEALRRLRGDGVRTVYVEGNRDFAIGRGATAGLFDAVIERDTTERFGEVTFHLSHGDLVNTRDRQYRLWRAFAKRLLAPIALRVLPAITAQRLADAIERRLRTTNRRHKSYFPGDACLDWARRHVAAGADIVVVGHFHRYERIDVEVDGRRGLFVSLPFWHAEPRPLLFDRAGNLTEGDDV